VDGKETAWKLECFPNGKQKVGEVGQALSTGTGIIIFTTFFCIENLANSCFVT
jgi:hypothetical protein